MKKTFPLKHPAKADARVVEDVIHDVRKYVKRERRKALPEGVDFWDFDCRVGGGGAEPSAVHLAEVVPAIEAAAKAGAENVYVEILAKPGVRTKKPEVVAPGTVIEPVIEADAPDTEIKDL